MNLQDIYQRYKNPELVLVYQFGKVGSTTLADSIPGAVNVHDLFGNPLCPCGFKYRNSFSYRHLRFPIDRLMRRTLIRRRKNTDIIVPLRAPWERNISLFFQDFPFWYVNFFATRKTTQKVEGLELIQRVFLESFDHDGPENWFNGEFTRLTGITLNDINFDKTAGHTIVQRAPYRCLLLTTAHMRSEQGIETIEKFVGRPVKLDDKNRGDLKWYGPVYKEFLSDTKFIGEYKERLSATPVHKTFFE